MFQTKERYSMQDLMDIVALLRDPVDGCPWDKEQTHQSIRQNLLEETYEVADAIDLVDAHLLCEELGDMLLQVALHTQMEQEQNVFTIEDVTTGICKKLILRHPHIFGDVTANDTTQVLQNWESIKREEKGRTTAAENLDSVPAALPALMHCAKVQKRAAAYVPQSDVSQTIETLQKTLACLQQASAQNDAAAVESLVGTALFETVTLARNTKVEPEQALSKATAGFVQQVKNMESLVAESKMTLDELSQEERGKLWTQTTVFTK